jgi:hypothetical protein
MNATKRDTVKVTNSSINALVVDSIFTQTDAFTVDCVDGTVRTDTLKIGVSFTPTTLSNYSDTLYLRNNSQTPLVKIPLSGNASELPVELVDFNASISNSKIVLKWQTATEVNNYGFEVEKRTVNDKPTSAINAWRKIFFISGHGTSNAPHEYSYSDVCLISGRYAYRLKQIDNNGAYKYSQSLEVEISIPKIFTLSQNYPNPFNSSTTITFTLAEDGRTSLKVFDLLGKEVATLVDAELSTGVFYEYQFDAPRLASGPYFYRLESGKHHLVRKLLMMK